MPVTIAPQSIAARGEALYTTRLTALLEPAHTGEYVAIDVDTGGYFLGRTLMEAGQKARARYLDRAFHFIKVGSPVAQRWKG